MKIRYAINARIPTPRAHGFQVMKTCEALARAGAEVELVVPRRHLFVTEDPFDYYTVEPIFKITYLSTIEFSWGGASRWFALQTLAFTFSLAHYVKRHHDSSILYVRGELGWLLPLMSRASFIWESHIRPRRFRAEARAVRHAHGVVVVTKRYCEDLIRDYGLPREAVLVAPDGVDLTEFSPDRGKHEARKKLGLPSDKKFAIYVGSDVPWKGVHYLREASQFLPDNYEIVFVGLVEPRGAGRGERYVGMRPFKERALWMHAADALVLTGDPSSETARYYTSPIKLFEYMAARRPIVATDLPSFRDILSEESAVLVTQGDSRALADGIVRAFTGEGRDARVEKAWQAVQAYSWQRRAERILTFIRDHT